MVTNTLKKLYKRDLERLKQELSLYKNEENLWLKADGINNPGGNLCLHLVGNLNKFIGDVLGKSGYVRQRDHEFSATGIPREALVKMINETGEIIEYTLDRLSPDALEEEYPLDVFQEKMSVEFFLIHLSSHLTYHLGQLNYHRRLLDR